jgi:hypothetical protein
MHGQVGLGVTIEIQSAQGNSSRDGLLEDPGQDD